MYCQVILSFVNIFDNILPSFLNKMLGPEQKPS